MNMSDKCLFINDCAVCWIKYCIINLLQVIWITKNCVPFSHIILFGSEFLHRFLVGKPEGKRPLGRPRLRWEHNIKMDLQEVGGSCGDWMELAQDRDSWRALVSTVRNLRVPKMRGIS